MHKDTKGKAKTETKNWAIKENFRRLLHGKFDSFMLNRTYQICWLFVFLLLSEGFTSLKETTTVGFPVQTGALLCLDTVRMSVISDTAACVCLFSHEAILKNYQQDRLGYTEAPQNLGEFHTLVRPSFEHLCMVWRHSKLDANLSIITTYSQ